MKKTLAIVGGGSASLLLAAHIDPKLFDVTIYEKNKSLGRKFLVAGDGGFNLTHSEPMFQFVERYSPSPFLRQALLDFTNEDLIKWMADVGVPTFVGSSKRVFPEKEIKPIDVLNKILQVLKQNEVNIKYEYKWTGWNTDNELLFNSSTIVKADHIVFALGGGSWKVTGSDGTWLDTFAKKGIEILPFLASNCAFKIAWEVDFIKQNAGEALKNISISKNEKIVKGELVITSFGIEGNAIYALSEEIQNDLLLKNESLIFIDLKPGFTQQALLEKMHRSRGNQSTGDFLKKELKMSKAQVALLKTNLTKEDYLNPETLSQKIKKLPLIITQSATVDEAISTLGGVDLNEVGSNFELKKLKHNYCIGEMLNWNAPTGGYLLQACFSMGVFLARHLNKTV